MALTERLLYLVAIWLLTCAILVERRGAATAAMTHLEIQDTSGHTRIVLGTDANGTAELRFVDATGKKISQVQQYRDGSTSMQFAGTANSPSVAINAMQQRPSPIIALAGNSDDQRLYLGATDHQDDVPSLSSKGICLGAVRPGRRFQASIRSNRCVS